jgi:SAM-dependent methyltransferase
MKSLAEIYAPYSSPQCHGDKGTVHSYIEVYDRLLASFRAKPGLNILEVGILNGSSLRMWEEYFNLATVYGIDSSYTPLDMADLRTMIAEGTHHIRILDATNCQQVAEHFGDVTFDVIIEDASHILEDQLCIYANFKDKMAPGGLYIIEDVADLDTVRPLFENIDPRRKVEVMDRRSIKNRFDDVLVLIQC